MWSSVVCAKNPAQAWRIAVLTLIVMVVGCSRAKTRTTPPKADSAATKSREAAQHDVSEAQAEVDKLGAAVTKTEVVLESLRAKAKAEENSPTPLGPEAQEALTKEIAAIEAQLIDQRAALNAATNELTSRNIDLQNAQQEANAVRNDPDKK